MNLRKIILIPLGFIFLALAGVGIAIPVLPATPFVFLSALCFGKSSDKLKNWFMNTTIYKSIAVKKGQKMTKKAKISVLLSVTFSLALSAYLVRHNTLVLIILAIVWLGHMYYFIFKK